MRIALSATSTTEFRVPRLTNRVVWSTRYNLDWKKIKRFPRRDVVQEDPKTGRVTVTIEELAYSNMFMVEALFELLAEKGILNGVEVKERVKKLQAETKLNFPRIQ